MQMTNLFMAMLLMGGLAGCAVPPPLQPAPLVAIPGPGKTEAQFREDDASCRTAAAQAPADAPSQPTTAQANAAEAKASQSAAAQPGPSQGQATANPAVAAAVPSGVVYLQCMATRQNIVEPLAPAPPILYGYYPAYPIYAGIGFGFPYFYNDVIAFNFYNRGYGRFYGYGGYRNYGFRDYGFRDGGFRHGGFGGGGFRHGGFGGGFRGHGGRH